MAVQDALLTEAADALTASQSALQQTERERDEAQALNVTVESMGVERMLAVGAVERDLVAVRALLRLARPYVQAAASADHLTDGFDIGLDGMPCQRHDVPITEADRLSANIAACLNRAEQNINVAAFQSALQAAESALQAREQEIARLRDVLKADGLDPDMPLPPGLHLQTERVEAALAILQRQHRATLDEAAVIYRGFENVSLNGVVCSIPDDGLDATLHRTWCARCRALWLRLKAISEAALTERG